MTDHFFMRAQHFLPLFVVCLTGAAIAQAAPDYSHEPFVIEQTIRRVEFHNDGASKAENTARIQIKSEAGVRAFGQLVFGYNSANERLDISYVRVRKPDGQVITAGTDAVQDLSGPIERVAPVYTDYRQKHVTVPALRPGDTLEYRVITTVEKPVAAGHFWLEYSFQDDAIVLDEQLEVTVPRERELKLKSKPGLEPVVTTDGGRRIYRWTSSHKIREDEPEPDKAKKKKRKPESPDVQLTTFPSWAEVGQWYAGLQRERSRPGPELRAKAAELVGGRATEMEKLQAIYDYVAKGFRYVSLSFGVGRYQPHTAKEILANEYGDCKDKHTLLAALAEAAGFPVSTVLIHSSRKLDPDVPSPAQFDHVISLVKVGQEDVWLDTTTEVAPFRLLAFALRNKQALVIPPDGSAQLMETPADAPFPSVRSVDVQGSINPLGKLTVHVRQSFRGDTELAPRLGFRRTPETKWKELLQLVSSADFGGRGDIDELDIGSVTATDQPFLLQFQYSRPGFVDWSKKVVAVELPLPRFSLPVADEQTEEPVEIGPPGEFTATLKLELPEKYEARLPVPVSVTRDYGEYRSAYRLEGHTLFVQRSLVTRRSELPANRVGDFIAFRQAIVSDLDQKLSLESAGGGAADNAAGLSVKELNEAGISALNNHNYKVAVDLFQRVVAKEPKHLSAWNNLGRAYVGMNQWDEGIAAYRQQIEINPFDRYAYNNLGLVLRRQQKWEEAIAAFQKQIEVSPLDRFAHHNLGLIYLDRHQWAEAAPELEKAVSLDPSNAAIQAQLGRAYLNVGQEEKAMSTFSKAAELGPTPFVWNTIAYSLALKHVHLDQAQQYAESAVASASAVLRNLSLDNLRQQDLTLVDTMAASWDTLGWILYQRGETARGERLIRAAWTVSQRGEIADHLGEICERRGEKEKAIRFYAEAIATVHPGVTTRPRLVALVGENQVDALVERARAELVTTRTLKVGQLVNAEARGDFFVLLAPGKREEVKFLSGDERLRAATEALRSADYGQDFADTPTKILRRGTVFCVPNANCTLVLEVPENVTTVD